MKIGCWWNAEKISPLAHLCALSRIYHYVHGVVAHQKLLKLQKFQRETWRQCQGWLRNKEIEILNLLCVRARHTHCVPLACTDLLLISCCTKCKNFKGRPGSNVKGDSETKKLSSWICCVCARAFIFTFFFAKKRWRVTTPAVTVGQNQFFRK